MNSRNSRIRMVTTSITIDSAQVMPPEGSKTVENRACHCFSTQETAVYSQSSNGELLLRGPLQGRHGSMGTADSPARRVAAVAGSGLGNGAGRLGDEAGRLGDEVDA